MPGPWTRFLRQAPAIVPTESAVLTFVLLVGVVGIVAWDGARPGVVIEVAVLGYLCDCLVHQAVAPLMSVPIGARLYVRLAQERRANLTGHECLLMQAKTRSNSH